MVETSNGQQQHLPTVNLAAAAEINAILTNNIVFQHVYCESHI